MRAPYIPVRSVPIAGVPKGDDVRMITDLTFSPGDGEHDMNSAVDRARLPNVSWPTVHDAVQDCYALQQACGSGVHALAGAVWDVWSAYRMLHVQRRFCWLQAYWFAQRWVSEERGSFGSSALPHLYMGHASLLLEVSRGFMDKLELGDPLADVGSPRVQRWLRARAGMPAAQRRLYAISVFTDDNLSLAVGVRRAARLCLVSEFVHLKAGLLLQKGQGPTAGGVVFLGVGLSFKHACPFVKESRRSELMGAISALVPRRDEFGRLICKRALHTVASKLSFVGTCFRRSRHRLSEAFFWACRDTLPARLTKGFVPAGRTLVANLWSFHDALEARDTLSFKEVMCGDAPLGGAAPLFVGLADAAGEPGVGMGFWLPDGRYAYVPSTQRHRDWLGICALEAAANVLLKMVLARTGVVGAARCGVDNAGWALISARGRARTASCRYWLARMMQVEAWAPGARWLDVWLCGEANFLADAASRRKLDVLRQFCAERGLALTKVPVPPEFEAWLEEAVVAAQVEFAALGKSVQCHGYPGVSSGRVVSADDASNSEAAAAVAAGLLVSA